MSENEKDENPPLVPDVSIKKSRPTRKVPTIEWQTKGSFDDKDIPKEELQRSRGDQQKIDELNMLLEKEKQKSLRLQADYQNLKNEQQRLLFDKYRLLFGPTKSSLANSAGIFLGNEFHYDLVRPGAAIFGIQPITNESNKVFEKIQFITTNWDAKDVSGRQLFI